jgi:hypothetical protein
MLPWEAKYVDQRCIGKKNRPVPALSLTADPAERHLRGSSLVASALALEYSLPTSIGPSNLVPGRALLCARHQIAQLKPFSTVFSRVEHDIPASQKRGFRCRPGWTELSDLRVLHP